MRDRLPTHALGLGEVQGDPEEVHCPLLDRHEHFRPDHLQRVQVRQRLVHSRAAQRPDRAAACGAHRLERHQLGRRLPPHSVPRRRARRESLAQDPGVLGLRAPRRADRACERFQRRLHGNLPPRPR
eukprot:Amastigsp_a174760_125.p6 type:complete len:127 gc:universal Amastigsp_a174760_125:1454-1834(+)